MTRWRVTREQWRNFKLYDRFIDAAEEMITRTSLANAPWTIVEGGDDRYRSLDDRNAHQGRHPRAPRRAACRRQTEVQRRDTGEEAPRDGVREGAPDSSVPPSRRS